MAETSSTVTMHGLAHYANMQPAETALKTAIDVLNDQLATIEKERAKLESERIAFEMVKKTVLNFKTPIRLNVGGKRFMTTQDTLNKEDSMLKAMFSGRHTIAVSYSK